MIALSAMTRALHLPLGVWPSLALGAAILVSVFLNGWHGPPG